MDYEAGSASTEKSKDTTSTSGVTTTKEVTNKIYADSTSSSIGSVTKVDSKETLGEDSFSGRRLVKDIKIGAGENYNTYSMFYEVEDYVNDTFANAAYSDVAARMYVFNTDAEASKAGLSKGEYLLSSDTGAALSSQLAYASYSFLSTNFINNPYAIQAGADSFTKIEGDDGVTYSIETTYSVDGDLNDTINYSIKMALKFDEEGKLLNYKNEYEVDDVNKEDPTDHYVSSTVSEGSIEYLAKEASFSGIPFEVEDYFLQSVKDITVLNSSVPRTEESPTAFPLSSSFLFATPKDYEPAKTIDVDENTLTRVSSTNKNVITLTDDGYFETKAAGETTLRFSYFGKNDKGVYEEMFIDKVINVVTGTPTAINLLLTTPDDYVNSNGDHELLVGTSYSMNVTVSPSSTDQTITASSSAKDVLAASVDAKKVILEPLKAGKTTLTVASASTPKIAAARNYEIYERKADTEIASLIQSKTWTFSSIYGKDIITLTFLSDGLGKLKEETDKGTFDTDTFKYTLEGYTIHTSDWTYNPWGKDSPYVDATIWPDAENFQFYNEEAYSTHVYTINK